MFYIMMAVFAYWSWGALYITRAVMIVHQWQKAVEAQHQADGRARVKHHPMEEVNGFVLAYGLGSILMGARAFSPGMRLVFLTGMLENIHTSYPQVTQEEYTRLITALQPLLTE